MIKVDHISTYFCGFKPLEHKPIGIIQRSIRNLRPETTKQWLVGKDWYFTSSPLLVKTAFFNRQIKNIDNLG